MRLSLAPATLAAIGALFLSSTAQANGYGNVAYYGLRGSFVITEDGSTHGQVNFDYNEQYEDGFAAGAFVGWVLDSNFRLEGEGMYRSADIDDVIMIRDGLLSPPTPPGTRIDAGGDAQVGTAMVNLYYDLTFLESEILPWIGGGLGGAFVDYEIDATVPDPMDPFSTIQLLGAKDTTWVFAYQFMAGITFPIGQGMSMSAAYRFFQTQDFVYVDNWGEEFETDLTQHSFDVSLQFHL